MSFGGGLEPSEVERARRSRVWLLSPAIATAIFFIAQFLLAALADPPSSRVKGAGTEGPSATPVKVRVVSEIRSFDERRFASAKVPKSESELLELMKNRGTVVFLPSEVDTVGTVEKKFADQEVGVIKVDSKDKQR